MASWSFLGRASSTEAMARASVTETMDSGWASDFHSKGCCCVASSSSIVVYSLTREGGFAASFVLPTAHCTNYELKFLSMGLFSSLDERRRT